ncbi:MAG: acyltransferase family protein [Lactobacillaceae bacterium]|jgi:peptidoglycan/LPS O-acetylase OafA/YrhL|nr:acyltransferase family protein [Lactobacillaceae bacterium]
MNIALLSKYRTQLMGLAMLWVMLYHFATYGSNNTPAPFRQFVSLGFGGVDIFIFVSGIGMYSSLLKDSAVRSFFKKRFSRIMPNYYMVIILVTLFSLFGLGIKFDWNIIINELLIFPYWFTGIAFNWYIPAILTFYLISPLYFKVFMNVKSKGLLTLGASIVVLGLSVLIYGLNAANVINLDIQVALTRIPIFFIGFYFAHLMKNAVQIKLNVWLVAIITAIVIIAELLILKKLNPNFLRASGLYWYLFIIITPLLSLLITTTLNWLAPHGKWLLSTLTWLGANSLDIYLIHIALNDFVYVKFSEKLVHTPAILWSFNLVWLLGSLVIAAIFAKLMKIITAKIFN